MTASFHRAALGLAAAAALAAAALAGPVLAAPKIGEPAPEFTGTDTQGKTHSLSDFKGKTVVLEWTNHGCPYVVKHYDTGNMQALQKEAAEKDIVWLSVISSAPGTQGHVTALEADELTETRSAAPTAVLLDPDGEIGRKFDARVTPHMYVITPDGKLAYAGAIDDKPTTDNADVKTAVNYVRSALAQVAAGKPADPALTRAYGCSIKYKS